MTNIVQSDIMPSGVKLDGSSNYVDGGGNKTAREDGY